MSTLLFPARARPASARRTALDPNRPAQARHPLLWVSSALAAATVVFSVALVAGKLLSHDAVALEIAPVEPDPFYQQKLDAKEEELPAQF